MVKVLCYKSEGPCPYSYPDESTPLHYTIFLYDPFNIILPSNLILTKGSLRDFRQMRSTLFCDITQRTEIIHYRRFGTNYWPPSSKVKKFKFWIFGPLSQLILFLHLDGLHLPPLNTGCTRFEVSIFCGKINVWQLETLTPSLFILNTGRDDTFFKL